MLSESDVCNIGFYMHVLLVHIGVASFANHWLILIISVRYRNKWWVQLVIWMLNVGKILETAAGLSVMKLIAEYLSLFIDCHFFGMMTGQLSIGVFRDFEIGAI